MLAFILHLLQNSLVLIRSAASQPPLKVLKSNPGLGLLIFSSSSPLVFLTCRYFSIPLFGLSLIEISGKELLVAYFCCFGLYLFYFLKRACKANASLALSIKNLLLALFFVLVSNVLVVIRLMLLIRTFPAFLPSASLAFKLFSVDSRLILFHFGFIVPITFYCLRWVTPLLTRWLSNPWRPLGWWWAEFQALRCPLVVLTLVYLFLFLTLFTLVLSSFLLDYLSPLSESLFVTGRIVLDYSNQGPPTPPPRTEPSRRPVPDIIVTPPTPAPCPESRPQTLGNPTLSPQR